MSARRLLALLVVVALGLLLMCPTALSRPEHPLVDATGAGDATNPGDEEDPDIPNGNIDGDDDNWDKSAVNGYTVAESFGESGGVVWGADTSGSEDVLSRMEISLSMRLTLLLQSWVIFSGLR
ncbi:MAG: hypothetical protein ABIE42_07150 [Candidatus Eisenbacteria bacterium]